MEEEKPTSSLDDEIEIEARTLVEYRNELVNMDVLTKLCSSEDVTGGSADGLVDSTNIEEEKPASSLDDDDETEDRSIVEYDEKSATSRDDDDEIEDRTIVKYDDELVVRDIMTKLWNSEDVTGGSADRLVDSLNIRDEKPASSLDNDDDDERVGRTIVESGNESVDGDGLTKLWISDEVTGGTVDGLIDSANFEDEKTAGSSEDKYKAEDSKLVEYGNELVCSDVLTKHWSLEGVAEGAADGLVDSANIEVEKIACFPDDNDGTEDSTHVKYAKELVAAGGNSEIVVASIDTIVWLATSGDSEVVSIGSADTIVGIGAGADTIVGIGAGGDSEVVGSADTILILSLVLVLVVILKLLAVLILSTDTIVGIGAGGAGGAGAVVVVASTDTIVGFGGCGDSDVGVGSIDTVNVSEGRTLVQPVIEVVDRFALTVLVGGEEVAELGPAVLFICVGIEDGTLSDSLFVDVLVEMILFISGVEVVVRRLETCVKVVNTVKFAVL
ncbi:hypothetical protein OS493_021071 [Desmophyllum pertusum]|uniref:Uncharacterized protein n=1 Tax=Desmophyllum pertusum TaxID=174260 RepID=A0A9X0D8T5_9CNID|nr:hypothetical protein OS493_021071 [Desmophyllum pertusum]